MSRPWMPMWWGDYFADTKHLSMEQHGAYFLLMGHYWQHGPLPDDPIRLRRIVGATPRQWARVWPFVSQFFDLVQCQHAQNDFVEQANAKQLLGNCWRHKRLDREIESAEIISTKRQLAGQRGGLKSSGRSNRARHSEQANAKQTGHHPHPHINTSPQSIPPRAREGESGEGLADGKAIVIASSELAALNRLKGWTTQ
jgi:uncharacterized protein YdaU (DUF1376 family)